MYTINIRGKQNPKDQKMVKLEMIFFKTGYARVPKVLNITGLLKDWDAKSQSFRVGSAEATTKNKLLFDLRTKYLHVADTWEAEERNWSPVQLSHCFDEIKQTQSEIKVKSVLQMIDYLEARFREKKRVKNNLIVDSSNNAKNMPSYARYCRLSRKRHTAKHSPHTFSLTSPNTSCWISLSGLKSKASGTATKED